MQKKLHLLFALLIFFVSQAMAQITTSSLSGKITANNEDVIGATIRVTMNLPVLFMEQPPMPMAVTLSRVCNLVVLTKWKFPTSVTLLRF